MQQQRQKHSEPSSAPQAAPDFVQEQSQCYIVILIFVQGDKHIRNRMPPRTLHAHPSRATLNLKIYYQLELTLLT